MGDHQLTHDINMDIIISMKMATQIEIISPPIIVKSVLVVHAYKVSATVNAAVVVAA